MLEKTLRLFCGNESLAERKEVWPIPEEQDVSFIQSYVERLIEKIRQIAPLQRTISQEYSYVVKLANLPQLTDNETLIDWCRTQYLQLHASFLQWRTPYVELMTAVPKRGSMPYLGILTNNQKRFTATCHALLVAATDQLLCALITEGEDHRHCVDQWYSTDLPQFVLSQCQPEYINHSELQRFLSQCTFTKIRHVMQITVTCQAHCKQAIQDHKITPQQARKYRRYLTQNAIDASMDFWFHNFWEPRPWTEELANGFCRYVYEYLDQKDRTVSENRQQFLADFQMRLEGHVKKMQEKPKKKR